MTYGAIDLVAFANRQHSSVNRNRGEGRGRAEERGASSVEWPAAAAFAHLCSLPGRFPPLVFLVLLLLLWTCVSCRIAIAAMRSAARNWEPARCSEAEENRKLGPAFTGLPTPIYSTSPPFPRRLAVARKRRAIYRNLARSERLRHVLTIQFEH